MDYPGILPAEENSEPLRYFFYLHPAYIGYSLRDRPSGSAGGAIFTGEV